MKKLIILFSLTVFSCFNSFGQGHIEGPIIMKFGNTYEIESPDLLLDTNGVHKVVFDLTGQSTETNKVNSYVNTLARFINMHVNSGVKLENLHIAAVFHSNATYSILDNVAYQEKYSSINPNEYLIKELNELGVELYVCSQSLHARKVDQESILSEIKVALSAMTVLINYQAKGYSLISF